MKKKIFILIIVSLMMLSSVACSNDDNEGKNEGQVESGEDEIGLDELGDMFSELDDMAKEAIEAEEAAKNLPDVDVVGCGEALTMGDMSYSVIGARMVEDDLVLKIEVLNNSEEIYDFNPYVNLALVDSEDEYASLITMFSSYEEDWLRGIILGDGNKMVGELAFNISELKAGDYTLKLGDMYGLRNAFVITPDDIGKTYDELFESNGVIGEYTVGDTIEFENVSITFDGVRIEPKTTYDSNYDEEGMGLMVLDMTITNNSDESLEFVSVSEFSTIRQVCAMDGRKLEYEDYSYSNRNWVENGETKQETFGLYYDEKDKDFYLLINPNIVDIEDLRVVTFSIE